MSSRLDDDDPVALRPDTLAALRAFLAERDAEADNAAREADDGGVALLTSEDWQLSQFWYDAETSTFLADEVARCCSAAASAAVQLHGSSSGDARDNGDVTVAFLSSPSAYKAFRSRGSTPGVSAVLLEYDPRFSVFGPDAFVRYDYRAPLDVPARLLGVCDVVLLDPPFLNTECLQGFAATVGALARPGHHTRVLLASGSVMLIDARRLLGVRPTRARIVHAEGRLSNPFSLYTNYPSSHAGGWDVEAESAAGAQANDLAHGTERSGSSAADIEKK